MGILSPFHHSVLLRNKVCFKGAHTVYFSIQKLIAPPFTLCRVCMLFDVIWQFIYILHITSFFRPEFLSLGLGI